MKLTNISVRNFRSYFNGPGEPTQKLSLGSSINLLVGPNNCGKSNLLRAVALALQDSGGAGFNHSYDIPRQLSRSYPAITLEFSTDGKASVEKTLLSCLEDYEQSAGVKKTNAANGEIVLRVTYRNSCREVTFGVKGSASKKGNEELNERALTQFKKCIRFIYLKSGEGLSNFLSGTFRELLHTVRQEHLSNEVTLAQQRRDEFIKKLKDDLLTPLGLHVKSELSQVMPEIDMVSIDPCVPSLEDILAGADITVTDSAETTLLNKGTGVRGALLVGLLTYLAKHSRRSLVLAVEEPESFLHPRAQQDLRDNLLKLSNRPDVSLLVTTHSPFMLSRSPSALITSLSKSETGRTLIGTQIRGDRSHSPVSTPLFGETITPALLDLVQPPKDGVQAILCVEGYTDKAYINSVLRLAGRLDLLEGLEIRSDEGAHKAAVQAILARQMLAKQIPVGALFDSDEMGRAAKSLLVDKFQWNSKHVFAYRKWRPDPSSAPVEAEDMFDEKLLNRFAASHPPCFIAEKVQYKSGRFHYGFTSDGKDHFLKFVETMLTPGDIGCWIKLVEDIRKGLGLQIAAVAK